MALGFLLAGAVGHRPDGDRAGGAGRGARAYLPWVAAAPVIGIAAWMLDGIFIGATETRAMRNAMILSVAVYACAVGAPAAGFRQPRASGRR